MTRPRVWMACEAASGPVSSAPAENDNRSHSGARTEGKSGDSAKRQGAQGKPLRRMLIIDEPGIMRDGLCALLTNEASVDIVAAVPSGPDGLQLPRSVRPDLVLMDLAVVTQTSPETIGRLRRRWPRVAIIILTFRRDQQLVETALAAGANAYILKTDNRAELFTALQQVTVGNHYVSPTVHQRDTAGYLRGADPSTRHAQSGQSALTEREREVIVLIAQGHRTRDIAELLSLSHKTVEKHRSTLMRKLGLRNATAVAAYAIAYGYLKI